MKLIKSVISISILLFTGFILTGCADTNKKSDAFSWEDIYTFKINKVYISHIEKDTIDDEYNSSTVDDKNRKNFNFENNMTESVSDLNQSTLGKYFHYAMLQAPVKNATVSIYELKNSNLLYETQTDKKDAKWRVVLPLLPDEQLLKVVVSGGNSSNQNVIAPLCAMVTVSDLKNKSITVDVVSTLLCEMDEKDKDFTDFKALYETTYYEKNNLEVHLFNAKIEDVFFNGISISDWKEDDSDGDNLSNWYEILHNLNPAKKDSDFDGIDDGDEVEQYGTNATKSDSDGDYLPDGFEIKNGSDPLVADENGNKILDGLEGDPFFEYQWYLNSVKSTAICTTTDVKTVAGNDLNILPLYHRTIGSTHGQTVVQVVDGGVDAKHEDIDVSLKYSLNSVNGTNDPSPTEGVSSNPIQIFYRGHGTAVAGIIGAKGLNGIGIRGVAPNVTIAGSNWLESQKIEALEKVWYMGKGADDIVVSNNSWGARIVDDKSYEYLMQSASEDLRDGKGRIFVFASGNDRKQYGNANLSYLINNPYAIAVAALNHKDKYASYSTPGSNVLTCAYGGEHYYEAPTIMTTFSTGLSMYASMLGGRKGPITIDEDSERNYTYAMNGTSAAAPMVSGALALVLDVCPFLAWRDIRWLIANTGEKVDENSTGWIKNSVGLWHSNDYGFGKINAVEMVKKCTSLEYRVLPKQKIVNIKYDDTQYIPDTNESIDIEMECDENLTIEWIGLTATIDHPYAGDIAIDIVSPFGTVSHLMVPNFLKSNIYSSGFRFSTVSLAGEKSKGVWTVRIRDALEKDSGKLMKLKMEIRGY